MVGSIHTVLGFVEKDDWGHLEEVVEDWTCICENGFVVRGQVKLNW